MIQRILTIKLSLIPESRSRTVDELVKEISEVFSNEGFIIPWCEKIKEITITET